MQEQWIIRTNAIDNQNLFDSTACIVESGRKRNGALLNPSPVTIANELFRFVFEQHLIWSNEIQYLFIYLKYKHDENDMRAHDAYNSLTVMISILTYTPKKKKQKNTASSLCLWLQAHARPYHSIDDSETCIFIRTTATHFK